MTLGKVPNPAFFILGSIARRIQYDWFEYYKRIIVLLETFVETQGFPGTCYKAANWIYFGQTQGRGRNDRHSRHAASVKYIYIYTLVKDYYRHLLTVQGAVSKKVNCSECINYLKDIFTRTKSKELRSKAPLPGA